MRRRRSVRRDDGITLFPFLAVLICTMGSLIVLLVVIVQQAKASAASVAQQRSQQREQQDEQREQLRLEQEELQWRVQVLRESRARTTEQLEDRRRELSHLEDVIRDLQRQLELAAAEARQIETGQPSPTFDLQAAQQHEQQLQHRLQQAKQALADARAKLNAQTPSFAIVPYDGPHGTRRRPIFVECLEDRVVLQPEGIELSGDDFREPITDDNPLASALRAKREYLADVLHDRDGQPYPLLIVRPQGSRAYAAARAAMKSWEAEFGYELIDADLPLEYPQVDAALVDSMRRAVQQSRDRRRYLKAIAPARFGRTQGVLRPSRRGGFERTPGGGGRSVGNEVTGLHAMADSNDWPRSESGSQRWSPAGGSSGMTDSKPSPRGAGSGRGNSDRANDTQRSPDAVPADGADSPTSVRPPSGETSRSAAARPGSAGHGHSPRRAGAPTQTESINGPDGSRSGASADRTDGPSSATATEGTGGPASQGATGDSSAPGAGGATSAQSLQGSVNFSDTRGPNWALRQNSAGATGITRPIRVTCYSDRLVLLPEDRRREKPELLAIQGNLGDEIDELVSKIWRRMDGWGIAGPGMYWKPVLLVQVRKTGESRYAELTQLLQSSGIVVKRKHP